MGQLSLRGWKQSLVGGAWHAAQPSRTFSSSMDRAPASPLAASRLLTVAPSHSLLVCSARHHSFYPSPVLPHLPFACLLQKCTASRPAERAPLLARPSALASRTGCERQGRSLSLSFSTAHRSAAPFHGAAPAPSVCDPDPLSFPACLGTQAQ
ncbi:hypothetical protein ABPG77_007137 [Micractinium sp. CCAP 211/92]